MHFILSNPHGLWALAATPLVVLVYFLQERTRRVTVSTLFLLERVRPESIGGRRFERLRSSWPMWLQILAIALLSWVLAGPRWIREDARQDVVFLLDGSASMSAFKDATREQIRKQISAWNTGGIITRWHLLDTNPQAGTLYAGESPALLLKAYDAWSPALGTHDFTPAFSTARGLVREQSGIVILFTDRKTETPADIAIVSAGEPVENVGFTGLTLQEKDGARVWRVLVRNHGKEKQKRDWWIEIPARADEMAQKTRRIMELQPGEVTALEGVFPPDTDRCEIVLQPDAFALDDRLPLIVPKPRKVRIGFGIGDERRESLRRVLASLPHVDTSAAEHDLWIGPWEGQEGETLAAPKQDEILLPRPLADGAKLDGNRVVAEDHPLTRDLNWMALLGPAPRKMKRLENDTPLLWQGQETAAVLRSWGAHRQLVLNLDITQGNATRVPAFVLMLHRFIGQTRESLPGERFENLECGQSLADVLPPLAGKKVRLTGPDGSEQALALRAPVKPGFFEVMADDQRVLTASAFFADTREADFSKAERLDTTDTLKAASKLSNTEDDRWRPVWIMLAAACLIAAWAFQGRRAAQDAALAGRLAV